MKNLSFNSLLIIFFLVLFALACKKAQSKVHTQKKVNAKSMELTTMNPQATSLLGIELNSPQPSSSLVEKWKIKKMLFDEDPNDIDNIIWHGRFSAYLGDYLKAIEIYSKGIQQYPNEARLYRHRGHRYISIRKFSEAINDLKSAEALIKGQENKIEQDGMPNAQNIPVSTLHGNIYYHLGLAYYLSDDLENALKAYKKCLNTSENPDNVVSATHWIFSILSKMNEKDKATESLNQITKDLTVIENQSYLDLCLFYKGLASESELLPTAAPSSSSDAIKYGLANWHMQYGNQERGMQLLTSLSQQETWASFGVIAAEADLSRSQ